MKNFIRPIFLFLFILIFNVAAFAQWSPAGDKIKTQWGEQIDPNNVLPEYPRPIMERTQWMNLNGCWDYAIVPKGMEAPTVYDGKILVPFAVESSLSGVGKRVGGEKEVWYNRVFNVPEKWNGMNVLLHFGAVDWKTDVWVNDMKVGEHTGGYTPFSFNISSALKKGGNKLTVRVWDPTDKGVQPRGKQVERPEGVWYTPVTGIWQTVWLEPVPVCHITNVRTTPDIDLRRINVTVTTSENFTDRVRVKVFDGEQLVTEGLAVNKQAIELTMPENAKLWSPQSPFLYKTEVTLENNGKIVDKVNGYVAMRKYSTRRDKDGIVRLQLNNQDLFQFGPLDQGWWPDGLYTAPSDAALRYDVQKTKDFGFNMIRKHIKVEPARWYTHCDQLGIVVWQDMPSGDRNYEWQNWTYFDGIDFKRSPESEAVYRKEWKEVIDYLYSYPCIGVWVPFNEAWGQFKTPEIAAWTKQYDPSRLVNPASGGNHYTCGDMLDLHNYPAPEMYLYDAQRANVLGEFGGIGMICKEHLWEPDKNWGYVQFNSSQEATDEYQKYADMLYKLIPRGFSAAVYTQTSDVEIEINGLLTYDRKVVKLDEERLRKINEKICNALR